MLSLQCVHVHMQTNSDCGVLQGKGKLCWRAECMPYTCLCRSHVLLLSCLQTHLQQQSLGHQVLHMQPHAINRDCDYFIPSNDARKASTCKSYIQQQFNCRMHIQRSRYVVYDAIIAILFTYNLN